MKLITPSYKIVEQAPGMDGLFEAIEQAGRTCYQSVGTRYFAIPFNGREVPNIWHQIQAESTCERFSIVGGDGFYKNLIGYVSIADKDVPKFPGISEYESERDNMYHKNITARAFTERMIQSGHGAMLEMGTVYLTIDSYNKDFDEMRKKYQANQYSKIILHTDLHNLEEYNMYISTNYRVIMQGDAETWDEASDNNFCDNWLYDLKYMQEPTFHEKRICVRFTTDIGVSREANRHRVNSMAESSTRFCNYSKDKFGNELSIAINDDISIDEIHSAEENWEHYNCSSAGAKTIFQKMCFDIGLGNEDFNIIDTWIFTNMASEWGYMRLISLGWKPQQARRVLPLDLHTELNHCAFTSDWEHFFELRCNKSTVHPDMYKLAHALYLDMLRREFVSIRGRWK